MAVAVDVAGAMLFALWTKSEHRPTRDLDLLGFGEASGERLTAVFHELCSVEVEPDGLEFDPDSIRVTEIREGQSYQGQRVKLNARLGNTNIPVQVDIGFGDVVTPAAQRSGTGMYPMRPARPAAGRCGSSRALRTQMSSRRSSPTWTRKGLNAKPPGGRRAGRHPSAGCSTRQGNAMVATFGLCRQRRGNGLACPGSWRAGAACAGEAVAGENSGA